MRVLKSKVENLNKGKEMDLEDNYQACQWICQEINPNTIKNLRHLNSELEKY